MTMRIGVREAELLIAEVLVVSFSTRRGGAGSLAVAKLRKARQASGNSAVERIQELEVGLLGRRLGGLIRAAGWRVLVMST